MNHAHTFGKAEALLRDDPLIVMRHAMADKWHPKLKRLVETELNRQWEEAAQRIEVGLIVVTTDALQFQWTRKLTRVKRVPTLSMVNNSMELTESVEFGADSYDPFNGLLDLQAKRSDVDVFDIGYPKEDTILHKARVQDVEEYLRNTSKVETETTRKQIDKAYRDANSYWDPKLERGLTPKEIAKVLRATGVANNRARSELISRTTTMWAYNEGAHQTYLEQGVAAESWVASQDDVLCEFCVQMDGAIVRTEDPFLPAGEDVVGVEGGILSGPVGWSVGHPPLHPYCRCIVVPVIQEVDARFFADQGDQLRADYTRRVETGELQEARKRRARLTSSQRRRQIKGEPLKKPKQAAPKVPEPTTTVDPKLNLEDVLNKERQFVKGFDVEHASQIDPVTGKVKLRKSGEVDSITFTRSEVKNMRGDIMIHNHPGHSLNFSTDDIMFLAKHGLQETQVITDKFIYKMARIEGKKTVNPAQIRKLFNRRMKDVAKDIVKRYRGAELAIDEAGSLMIHETWTAVAKEIGLKYTRASL